MKCKRGCRLLHRFLDLLFRFNRFVVFILEVKELLFMKLCVAVTFCKEAGNKLQAFI